MGHELSATDEENGARKCRERQEKEAAIITYFGCIVAPGGSYGALVHVVRPFDVSLAASALSPTGDLGIVETRRTLEAQILGGRGFGRSR